MRKIGMLASVVFLAGCVAGGIKIDPQQAASMKPGEASYADVVTKFGRPNSETVLGDGTTLAVYSYFSASARPASFIPVIGPLVGGADSTTQMVMFKFGPNGKLIETTRTSSQNGVSRGVVTGIAPPARTNQPTTVP